MVKLDEILKDVITLTKEVSLFIDKEFKSFDSSNIEFKGLNDLVSYVDKRAEEKIVTDLESILPQSGFITEEGTSQKTGNQHKWIIDPLDGTTNFIHGLPVFSISIALMENSDVILGVVHEINRNETFYAAKESKAFCNDEQIHVSSTPNLSNSLLATGFPYHNFKKMDAYLSILNNFMQSTHGLRRMGSAAVDLAYVACGRFEGFFEYNLNVWDVAAGAFIVKQAGGRVSDFSGGDNFLFGKEIVASGSIHSEMLSIIQKYGL